MQNKKAFSLVEIIIAISIIVLLAVIGISSKQGYDENMNNTKVISDIDTINNALEAFNVETKTLPTPDGNTNFFKKDTSYAHSYEDAETFGVYGSITEKTIPKRFLEVAPLDPRTKNYYSYGKTKNSNEFELASIQVLKGKTTAKVTGNYTGEAGPYNLIREYNGNNFVYNGSLTNLPYNPEELILIATDKEGNIYKEGDVIKIATNGDVTKNSDIKVITTQVDGLEIFFSDGSVSILGTGSELTLNQLSFPKENNLSSIVKLSLGAGNIWTRATQLSDESEFQIYTQDSTAAVRGTIFGVVKNTGNTEILVVEGEVGIYNNIATREIQKTKLIQTQAIKILKAGEKLTITPSSSLDTLNIFTDQNIIAPNTFSKSTKIRDEETSLNIESGISTNPITAITFNTQTVAVDSELYASGYTLAYYAAYDSNIYLEENDGKRVIPKFNSLKVGTGTVTYKKLDKKDYNISTIGNSTGVYIDNTGNSSNSSSDYLKYEGLGLGENFAIEMSVRGSALQRNDDDEDYYLYDIGGTFLKMKNRYLRMGYPVGTGEAYKKLIYLSSLNTLDSNKFYKIIAIYNGSDWELKLNNLSTIRTRNTTSSQSLSDINIGSDSSNENQWDDIIDYVKIYKHK